MHASTLLRQAESILERVHSTLPAAAPGVLRLDEAIEARTLAEEAASGVRVWELEAYSRLLLARRPPQRPPRRLVVAVDSSARSLETPGATLVVASVAVSSNVAPVLGDWPGVYGAQLPLDGEPFISVLPNGYGEAEVDSPVATGRNPAGDPYDPDYSLAQAMDEARVRLENAALHALADAGEAGVLPLEGALVLVDGPLFPVTGALTYPGVRVEYREAWRSLLESRVSAVERLAGLGARVVGVVKRVSRSRLISQAPLLSERAAECAGRRGVSDYQALYAALARRGCVARAPGRVYATPLLGVRAGPGWVPARAARYLVVPLLRGLHSPEAARYMRVEALLSQAEEGVDPAGEALGDSVARGYPEPVTIALSDRRAKAATRALQAYLAWAARRLGVPVGLSSEIEVIAGGWRQGAGRMD